MKFEKISENKIRIILTKTDLIEKNINTNSFMANPIESQDLFLFALNKAEKEIGFTTQNSKLKIEAIAMHTGDFIFTITKVQPEFPESNKNNNNVLNPTSIKPTLHINRKKININTVNCIYKFDSFNDFYDFINIYYLQTNTNKNLIAKKILLYLYDNNYYLTFYNINSNTTTSKHFFLLLNEYSSIVHNNSSFLFKLQEYGELIFKNNALNTCLKYFAKKG